MTLHLQLIQRQLSHLENMCTYLEFSRNRIKEILPVADWKGLTPEQHEILTAFRVRFSEYQEHLGKTMRAVAIEEEVDADRFGAVLAFMEKTGVLESSDRWKLLRELRNAVNHEYEEDTVRLSIFFEEMAKGRSRLIQFCM